MTNITIQSAIKTNAVPIIYSPCSGQIQTPSQMRPISDAQIITRTYKGNFVKNSLANAAATAIFEKSKSVFDKASRLLSLIFIIIFNISYGMTTVKDKLAENSLSEQSSARRLIKKG